MRRKSKSAKKPVNKRKKRSGFLGYDRIIAKQTAQIKKQEARKQRAQLIVATADVRILKAREKIEVAEYQKQLKLDAKATAAGVQPVDSAEDEAKLAEVAEETATV
jgi:hypothetical protein